MKTRILIALGTRPEAIKFVPLIQALRKSPDFECFVCLTGQHREMLNQVIRLFKIKIDAGLRLMRTNQSLEYVSGRVVSKFGRIIRKIKPDLLFVQGDTATALMVAISSFYTKVAIAHLEAGLRTWNKYNPFPEEMNRTLITHLADYHFAPTEMAKRNLMHEGVPSNRIYVVGNTVVDAIHTASAIVKEDYPIFRTVDWSKRVLFVTAHRRENFGHGLREIYQAFKDIVQKYKDVEIVYPVHLNPRVYKPARKILGGLRRIHLMRPLTYEETCWLIRKCFLILTDSGGLQEEAPFFNKPVLVMRQATERWEGIRDGISKLVGANRQRIFCETSKLLNSPRAYQKMVPRSNPYGDGRSAEKILNSMRKIFRQTKANTVSRANASKVW